MKWAYDLTGAEPILRDEPVYDASALEHGELLMLGATDPDSNADQSRSFITAYNATPANSAVNAIGILNESTYNATDGTAPSRVFATNSAGAYYGKVIINPFAVYRAEHSIAAADDVAITSTSSTTVTIASLSDDIDGSWVYFPLTATGVKGSLRVLTAAASGSATMDSALTTAGTSSDTAVIIPPANMYSNNLSADGTKVASGNAQNIFGATNLRVVDSWIDRGAGLELLRVGTHRGLDNLHLVQGGRGPKFYCDLILKDHIFGVQE